MRNIYIKPSIELVNVDVETLLQTVSKLHPSDYKGNDLSDVNLDIDNKNGDDEDILCTKPNKHNLWDDEEW